MHRRSCLLVSTAGNFLLHLVPPWNKVLFEKLTASWLVKKFHAFYGNRRFISAFTSARHLSLPWASSIQSIPPHPTSWRSSLILFSHLRLGLANSLFPSVFPTKILYTAHTFKSNSTQSTAHYDNMGNKKRTDYTIKAQITATCFDLQSHRQAKLRTMKFFTMWLCVFGIPRWLTVCAVIRTVYITLLIYRV
jgi:hypothetical protein